MEAHGHRRLTQHVRSNWRNAVLVCRKCSKKLDGGFGEKGRMPLAKALRKQLALKKGRKAAAGIIEVGCLGVCPKGAVTVVNGSDSREWLLVRPGASLEDLASELALNEA
ncbi:(2Fe-2S) ferredoxin domain-containing protein [Sphingobium sp. H39-3-25]|uniref:(2Fe-2S) ferredoxin domain-containing protein n=1 Tax=Sphingobium arseniciresistens TaxID=3030834 RepID=UPI0023B9B9D9|nr:(2Fe-2S) ferredoxin domain-containing protein [Sphingobium arseniciresistens]